MDTDKTVRGTAATTARRNRVVLSESDEGLTLLRGLASQRGVAVPELLRLLIREEAARAGVSAATSVESEKVEPVRPVWERLASSMAALPSEALDTLPDDLAAQHDHYLYNAPKR